MFAERLLAIKAPSLIFHARDDTLQPFRNAELADRAIPDSTLVAFEHVKHLLLAAEQ